MEDDDEFGDLYTDVLRPFSSPAPPPLRRPIVANPPSPEPSHSPTRPAGSSGFVLNLAAGNDAERKDSASVDVELPIRVFENRGFGVESGIAGDLENGVDSMEKLDIEEGNAGVEDDQIIPGLNVEGFRANDAAQDRWDSDSEDDLQIVLNDNGGPMAMERGGMGGDKDEDDEDDRPLVILGDNGQNQAVEEQDWGEDAVPVADGERKDLGEAAKTNGGMVVVAPKLGYSNYSYRPFHSQYKQL